MDPITPPPLAIPVTVVKPESKQVSNYVGVSLVGVAGWLVANQDTVVAFVPAPWNLVATAVIGLMGAGLVAYREKKPK